MKVKLAEQSISKQEVSDLIEWLQNTDRYTKGEQTLLFEKEWSEWVGMPYSIFVNSGSSANLLIFLSLLYSDKLKNKKVILPAVSWATTVAPAIQFGFEPILCDCDPEDFGLSVEDFESLCEQHRPSFAVLVHVLGHANKMKQIREICDKYDVHLIEDACEAPGSKLGNNNLGSMGLASSFSFFYGHQMSTIEGGMVSTKDRDLYNVMLSVRSHGWLRDNEPYFRKRHLEKHDISDFDSKYFFVFPGLNIRSTDLSAFIGRLQIKKIDSFTETRNKNYERYANILGSKTRIQRSDTNLVSSLGFGIVNENRDKIVKELNANNVETRPLICGSIQEHPFWNTRYEKRPLPNASVLHKNGFYVPCHQNMSSEEVDFICQLILKNL